MLVAKGNDFEIIHDLGRKYNRLVDEKFALTERLKSDNLYVEQRVNLRLQLAELHHHILRTDNLRNAIAFGWKYQPLTDSALSLRHEIEKELEPVIRENTSSLFDQLRRYRKQVFQKSELIVYYRDAFNRANQRLSENGLRPIPMRESLQPIEPALNNV